MVQEIIKGYFNDPKVDYNAKDGHHELPMKKQYREVSDPMAA